MTQITCESGILAKALRDISSITEKTDVTILRNVLIEAAKGGKVTLTTTNFDMMVSRTIQAEVVKPGSFTVEIARFASVMSSFDSGAVAELTATTALAVKCARSNFRFQTLPADDFPKLPFDKPTATIECGSDFIEAVAAVRHAVSTVTGRYHLCGISVQRRDGRLFAQACDGDRMARRWIGATSEDVPDIIIGTKAVDKFLDLAAGCDKAIAIEFGDQRIRVTMGSDVLTAKMVDATFPDLDKIMPPEFPLMARVDSRSLSAGLARVGLLAEDKERTIRAIFGSNVLTLENRGAAGDHGVEEVPCDYAGDKFEIFFRGVHLREAIASIDIETVEMGMIDRLSPMLMSGREDCTMLIMPMRS